MYVTEQLHETLTFRENGNVNAELSRRNSSEGLKKMLLRFPKDGEGIIPKCSKQISISEIVYIRKWVIFFYDQILSRVFTLIMLVYMFIQRNINHFKSF